MGRHKKLIKEEVNQKTLKERIVYYPDTGNFFWLRKLNRMMDISVPAGNTEKGYVYIKFFGKLYMAHRLAWLYMTGEWPKEFIDHKDNNPLNNKWENLREATRQQNNSNVLKRKTNTSGYKGVFKLPNGMFLARIRKDTIPYNLGTFKTKEEAALVYNEAAIEKFGEFANLNVLETKCS